MHVGSLRGDGVFCQQVTGPGFNPLHCKCKYVNVCVCIYVLGKSVCRRDIRLILLSFYLKTNFIFSFFSDVGVLFCNLRIRSICKLSGT